MTRHGGELEIQLTGGPDSLFEGPARERLERDVLPAYLPSRRWFGGKARRVEAVHVQDWAPFLPPPAAVFLVLLEVRFAGGGADQYFFPLGVAAAPASPSHVLARVTGPRGEGVVQDALADPAACTALLELVGEGRQVAMGHGTVRGTPTAAFGEVRGDPASPLDVTLGPPTSSNSLVFYGRRLLLKVFRRLEAGTNPDFEIGRFLTERTGFTRTPKVAGALEYHPAGAGLRMLGILQELVPNQGDGWQHALGELAGYFDRVSTQPGPPETDGRNLLERAAGEPPPAVREAVAGYLDTAALLGRRTAELHGALAGDPHHPAFAPEAMTPGDLAALTEAVRYQGRLALDTLRDTMDRLPEALVPDASRFQEVAPGVLQDLDRRPGLRAGATKIRCHGDYHLGQVLWAGGDFVILDFEGEPTRTVEERRAKQSPLRDVAGMLRSLDYAAYAGLFAHAQDRPEEFARLEPWADLWQKWTTAAFLRGYRAAAAGGSFLPDEPAELLALLQAFMLEKAFYELVYELNNRPDWVRIPLRGLLTLLGQGQAAAGR